jgi:ribonuclease BN (tRNA processing enzyme)
MKIEVLGSYGGESDVCRMTCLLIEDAVALDAGSLTKALTVERQQQVQSIILSHSHMDHTTCLPFFIENVYAVRKHLFNNDVWPDFTRIPNHLLPALRFHELADEVPVEINGVRFTPIPVNHLVPTYGYLIEKGDSALLWSSDTGPTKRLWEIANQTKNLAQTWLEVSFDNSLQSIADLSKHLTPQTMAAELHQLKQRMPVLLHHLKPTCISRIEDNVRALGNPDVDFLEQGRTYEI